MEKLIKEGKEWRCWGAYQADTFTVQYTCSEGNVRKSTFDAGVEYKCNDCQGADRKVVHTFAAGDVASGRLQVHPETGDPQCPKCTGELIEQTDGPAHTWGGRDY